ncbi:MAG: hypothetical protein AAGA17_19065 [Actinomycetota bacterium]
MWRALVVGVNIGVVLALAIVLGRSDAEPTVDTVTAGDAPARIQPTPADPDGAASPVDETPSTSTTRPADLDITASAWVVIDLDGEVVAGDDVDRDLAIASLAKLPLALVATDDVLAVDSHVVSAEAAATPGRKVGWPAGTTVASEELVDALLRTSGNDAAIVTAQAAGGIDIVLAQISAIGGDGIADVSGIRSDTVATATDVAEWMRRALEWPELREALEARAGEPLPGQTGILLGNDREPTIVAAKTSFSTAAGRSMAALVSWEGTDRIVVVLNAQSPVDAALDAYIAAWWEGGT